MDRGTVRVKCLAQEHNTMSPARARTRTARSGIERTNHEAKAPPKLQNIGPLIYISLNHKRAFCVMPCYCSSKDFDTCNMGAPK